MDYLKLRQDELWLNFNREVPITSIVNGIYLIFLSAQEGAT